MLCATGGERTFEEVVARIRRIPAALHEVRVDRWSDVPPGRISSLPGRDRLLLTVRPGREGGGWTGAEETRVERLREAIDAGCAWVDVEASTPEPWRGELLARPGATRRLLSVHLRAGSEETPLAALARLGSLPAHALKVAVPIEDAADLEALRAAGASSRRDTVLVGMGEAGRLSRFAYRAFGSLFTYVAADDRNRTAPGQPTWDEALRMGLDRQTPQVFGLLGGPAAVRSPGPRVWNAVLPRSGRPLAYVALPTARPAAVISMLRADSPAGLSVTMPYKTIVRDLIDAEAPSARRAGSVNTIVREGDRLIGHSTDGAGALSALGAPGRLAGRRVLVLGAGGAARAFVRAAVDAGASVAVAARRPGAAAELAASLGAAAADWGAALDVPFDVLVNATPVGDDGISSPVADSAVLAGRIVLDMVIAREPTPLLRQAEAAGAAERIPGTAMWAHQGVLQMEILTGLRLDAADVRRRAESEA